MPVLECLECSSPKTISDSLEALAQDVFRTNFSRPGFSVLSFQHPLTSRELRAAMVDLKQKSSAWLESNLDRRLSYLSMGRFNHTSRGQVANATRKNHSHPKTISRAQPEIPTHDPSASSAEPEREERECCASF